MQGFYSVLLLVCSNVFMTFAWYGHLKLQQTGISKDWPLLLVILFSWGIALFEYMCQVPANRLRSLQFDTAEGYSGSGFAHRVHGNCHLDV